MTTIPTRRRGFAHGVREVIRSVLLLPTGTAAVGAVLAGRADVAWRRWLRAPGDDARPVPGARRVLAVAVMYALLGVPALVAVLFEVLFVLRGVLYGLVVSGPYDDAWGGPSRAGAWLAHFGAGLLIAAVGVASLRLIGWLRRGLAAWAEGERTGARVWVTALPLCAAAVAFVVAWLRQI